MRILWVSGFVPYPPAGGALQRSYHLLRLAGRSHEIHLVALDNLAPHLRANARTDAVRALLDVCASVEVFAGRFRESRLRWMLMAARTFFRSTPYDVNWLWQPEMGRFLHALALQVGFDVVHVDTIGLMRYDDSVPGVPIVLNHHNVESQMTHRRADGERSLSRRVYLRRDARKLERYERIACRRAAVNITVSALDAERLRAVVAGAETIVVENGVDLEYFRPRSGQPQEPASLIFAGTMNWYPNQEAMRYFLKDVWPLLLADNPERRLSIIGRDPPAEVLEATREGTVRAPGFVSDVRPYLAAAATYVCPIRDGGGTRLKVLDALAMGMPLVATGLAVEGLGLAEEVHYLRAETPPDYLRQIRRLETEPALRDQLSESGRRFVEQHYSWDVIGQHLLHAYEQAGRKGRCGENPS
jgi:glycosyltransferase involved in cell wall biosynthesis